MGLTTACHPFIDGLPPRIHVDIDEVLAEIVEDDCSFDDAGDVVPRPGAVPKSTAGSTPLFVVVPKHAKGGEENGEQAESMESGASYAIAQKRGPSYARSDERPIVSYIVVGSYSNKQESVAAEPRKIWDMREGRYEGMRRGCHLSDDLSLLQQAAHTVRA